jgi:hypothetical protein
MESDSKGQKNRFRDNIACVSDDSDVLQPFWVRCFIRYGDELDSFLLDYGLSFLLPFGSLFWFIFLIS